MLLLLEVSNTSKHNMPFLWEKNTNGFAIEYFEYYVQREASKLVEYYIRKIRKISLNFDR